MAGINHVVVAGNLTRDAELRTTGKQPVLSFTVAYNERRKNDQGKWEDAEPSFFSCVMFGDQAQRLQPFLTKGRKVVIDGRAKYRTWETSDGQKRSTVEFWVNNVIFMDNGKQAATEQVDVYDEDIPF